MSQLNPILATLGKLQTRTAMMAHLTQAVQGDTIRINRKDLQLAFTDIEQTISGICTQLTHQGEITFSSSLGGTLDHPMVEQFWDVYDYLDNLDNLDSLNRGSSVNHHSGDADTIAININQVYSVAKKNSQPLPDNMVELKQHLRDSCRYLFIDSNVAVSSQVFNGKTIKCWIFQKPVAEAQPTSAETAIDLAQACSDFEQTLSESAPVIEMTEAKIITRQWKDDGMVSHLYIPSVPVSKTERITQVGFIRAYGVELPTYYHDIDVSHFAEKTYYDENGDKQRVLVPLFKTRGEGEHTQTFYQRVGLLLPPID